MLRDPDSPEVQISKQGTGIFLDWKAAMGCIGAIAVGVFWTAIWTNNISRTTEEHTAALSELKQDVKAVNGKLDSLLYRSSLSRGLSENPSPK
jgi:hypothetical protein